jgi:hypothetical protein
MSALFADELKACEAVRSSKFGLLQATVGMSAFFAGDCWRNKVCHGFVKLAGAKDFLGVFANRVPTRKGIRGSTARCVQKRLELLCRQILGRYSERLAFRDHLRERSGSDPRNFGIGPTAEHR